MVNRTFVVLGTACVLLTLYGFLNLYRPSLTKLLRSRLKKNLYVYTYKPVVEDDDLLKVFIASIPEQYASPKGMNFEEIVGTDVIGAKISESLYMWDSVWHHVDKWWIHQLTVSQMRVHEVEDSDIVFIPGHYYFSGKDGEKFWLMMQNAYSIFPYLGEKPHLLVLNHPLDIFIGNLKVSPETAITMVTMNNAPFKNISSNHEYRRQSLRTVIAPYFWRTHQHPGILREKPSTTKEKRILE